MNYRVITLQLTKIPVVERSLGTALERLPRATLPAWGTDWTQPSLGRTRHYEFGSSTHLQTHAAHAGTWSIVFILYRHTLQSSNKLFIYAVLHFLAKTLQYLLEIYLWHITAQARRLDKLTFSFHLISFILVSALVSFLCSLTSFS